MTGEGLVVSNDKDGCIVEISKSSACGHDCASCGACQNPKYKIKVLNPVGARQGDRVQIESDTLSILGLSFILYMLPVFLLIISAIVCDALNLGYYSILFFVPLLLLWFFAIKKLNKTARVKNTIVKILDFQ